MACPICNSNLSPAFTAQVLHKYAANYELCRGCGFLCAREPYWLDEAYSSAITAADTGLVMRNISLASKIASILYAVLGDRGEGRYLDAAGGYGLLTRIMRDVGFNFYWTDKYCENLLARGFNYDPTIGPCKAVTAMEVMEHLINPVVFLDETLAVSRADTILFSTELYSGEPPRPGNWWYYAFPMGQHIGFYQKRTLEALGKKMGLHLTSAHGIHALSRQPLNAQHFALAANPYISRLATPLIRRMVGSRTFDDHQKMLRQH